MTLSSHLIGLAVILVVFGGMTVATFLEERGKQRDRVLCRSDGHVWRYRSSHQRLCARCSCREVADTAQGFLP